MGRTTGGKGMRIIVDILTDRKKLFGFFTDEGNPKEETRIIEIDSQDEIVNIFLCDKKNTLIPITREDLNSIGYFEQEE